MRDQFHIKGDWAKMHIHARTSFTVHIYIDKKYPVIAKGHMFSSFVHYCMPKDERVKETEKVFLCAHR